MKLINYSFLDRKQQRYEKSIILREGDFLHIVIDKKPQTEIIVQVHNSHLKIYPKEEFNESIKKRILN